MLIFHEGLPRSGKSYEAVVRHIVPALAKGRAVDAYIEGLNHQKIAVLAGITEERCQELLKQIQREDVPRIYHVARKNALIVLDEAQNFWPTGRQRLDEKMTQFVTEHGHLGQDILLMGQDIRDVHPIWRRRVSQKVLFHKLDALGEELRYNVTVFKAVAPEKFEKVTSQICKYDATYFGSYASHVDTETNTLNYVDTRANVKNAWWVRWGIPLAIGLAVWGIYTAWEFFHPAPVVKPQQVDASKVVANPPQVAASAVPQPQRQEPRTLVAQLSAKYRPRLGWYVGPAETGRPVGVLEWWDGDTVRERLTIAQVVALGETVTHTAGLVRVGGVWFTPWPVPRAEQPAAVGAQVVPLSAPGAAAGT